MFLSENLNLFKILMHNFYACFLRVFHWTNTLIEFSVNQRTMAIWTWPFHCIQSTDPHLLINENAICISYFVNILFS